MPRTPRLDHPSARHHVMNRGARRRAVFLDDRDHWVFLRKLGQLPERFGVEVHAYALMPNHYHMLLRTPEANLSIAMHWLGTSFSRFLNDAHAWDGPVFRGRYHSRLVESDAYWRHLLGYLHLNPVRGGLADSADEAWWTSHRAYTDCRHKPDWLTTEELMTQFGSCEAYRAYLADMMRGVQAGPPDFDEDALWKSAQTVRRTVAKTPVPPLASPFAIEREVARITEHSWKSNRRAQRGCRGDPGPQFLAWALWKVGNLGPTATGRRLGISGSSVHQRRQQFERRLADDLTAQRWVSEINSWKALMK